VTNLPTPAAPNIYSMSMHAQSPPNEAPLSLPNLSLSPADALAKLESNMSEAAKKESEGRELLNLDANDYDDFGVRYITADNFFGGNDTPNISFIRIVEFKDPSKVIFPGASLPGNLNKGTSLTDLPYHGATYKNTLVGVAGNRFKQFILTQLHESKQERMQLQENSEKFTLNFFGQRAQMITISGTLKNSPENPWTLNMIFAWDNYMRGSVLAEKGWICELYCDNVFYRGYPVNFTLGKIGGMDMIAQFTMQFVVWERKVTRASVASSALA